MKTAGLRSLIAAFLLLLDCTALFARPAPVEWQPKPMRRPPAETNAAALDGKWHSVRVTPSPDLPKIHTWQKFNPVWWVENADEPIPPKWYRSDERSRVTKWHFRNPFHNFVCYVIGVADKKTMRSGRYPEQTSNPNGGWNFAMTRRRIVLLPFVSYRQGRFEFYFGWRERGNFGIKINFSDSNKPHDSKPAAAKP